MVKTITAEISPVTGDITKHPLLRDRGIEFYNNIIQLEYEIELLKQTPEMKGQLKKLSDILKEQQLYLSIINAGFDPFYPSKEWYSGFLVDPKLKDNGKPLTYHVYSRAMPQHAINLYNKAKALNAFETFTVHSPDANLFQEVVVRAAPVDPILIGWVGSPKVTLNVINGRYLYDQAIGTNQPFLIAQWDIGKDLQAAGILQLKSG